MLPDSIYKIKIKDTHAQYSTLVLIFISLIFFIIIVSVWRHGSDNNPALIDNSEKELISRIGRVVALPDDEIPSLVVVSDPELLKDRMFSNNAKKGDKVLVYSKAQKAILYSVELERVIEIASLEADKNK